MKKLTSFAWLASGATALLLFACQPTTTTPAPPDPAKEIEAVTAVLDRMEALWSDSTLQSAAIIDSTLTLFAEDATVLPDGQPLVSGKPAIRKYWEDFFAAGFRAHLSIEKYDDIQVSGDLAFARYNADEMVIPVAGGETQTLHFKCVTMLERQTGGAWKIILHTWNDNAPPN